MLYLSPYYMSFAIEQQQQQQQQRTNKQTNKKKEKEKKREKSESPFGHFVSFQPSLTFSDRLILYFFSFASQPKFTSQHPKRQKLLQTFPSTDLCVISLLQTQILLGLGPRCKSIADFIAGLCPAIKDEARAILTRQAATGQLLLSHGVLFLARRSV